ncbi:MAG: hypothetical protein ABFD97_09560 [Syntrophobacter sp.]
MKALPFVLMLAVLAMPCSLFAQQDKTQAPAAQGGTKVQAAPAQPMSGDHMKKHDEMMSKMKEMDARLDEKVAAMDAAKGDQKVEAMAAVIKEMVSQRKTMQERMMKMHEMKAHEHMKGSTEGKAGKGKGM